MEENRFQGIRMLDREVLLVLAAYFLSMTAFGGMVGVLFNLYLVRLGYGLGTIGIVNGMIALSYCAFSFPAGLLARRWGIRRSLAVGTCGVVLYFAMMCLAEWLPEGLRLPWLRAALLIGGAAYAPKMACISPALMRTDPRARPTAFSLRLGLGILGISIGALVAGILTQAFARMAGVDAGNPLPYRAGLAVALGVEALALVPILALRRDGPVRAAEPASRTGPPPDAQKPIVLLFMVGAASLLAGVCANCVTAFFTLHLDRTFHVPTPLIGGVMSLTRALSLLPLLAAPLLTRRLGPLRLLLVTGAAGGLCCILIAGSPQWTGVAIGFCLLNLAASAAGGAGELLYQGAAGPSWSTVVAGTVNAAQGMGSAAIQFGGGYVMAAIGYPGLVLIAVAPQAAYLIILWLYFRVRRSRSP